MKLAGSSWNWLFVLAELCMYSWWRVVKMSRS